MAYMMTAIMTGGVAAIISLFTGAGIGQVALNYVIFGYLGMAALAFAVVCTHMRNRVSNS